MANTETKQNYDKVFADDKLNIKSNVIDFARLIEQDIYKANSTAKVYSITAKFGVGKTFFCDKLLQVLAKDEVKVGKLNIWEMDFYENPLIPILAELNNLYSNKGKKLPSKIIDTIGKVSSKSLSTMCEIFSRMASNEILGADVIDVCKEKFSSETIYDDYNEYKKALKELKTLLTQWASKQKNKPIVVIIDELDRCKPDYAIKTLEVLKHFFDVSGFVFVLAIDDEQLKNSVQTLFGAIDYEGYKRKFINNSFILPKPNRLAFAKYLYEKSDIRNYIEQIQKNKRELVFTVNIYNAFMCAYPYSEYCNMDKQIMAQNFNKEQTSESIIKRYFAAYSELFGFSLRKMEQVFDRLILFIKQISISNELFSPDLATLLICVHEGDSEIFMRLKNTKNCNTYIIEQLFAHNTISYTYQVYKDLAFSKFKEFSRKIAPKLIDVATYSCNISSKNGQLQQVIYDNVDRFYMGNPERWLYEQDAIETNGTLTYDKKFDREKFKKSYCKHIDFISRFEIALNVSSTDARI